MSRSLIKSLAGISTVILIAMAVFVLSNMSVQTIMSTDAVTSLVWSPDGKTLAIGSSDGAILLWDMHSNKLRQKIHVDSGVVSLAWSPDSKMLASGIWTDTEPGAVTLWDADTGSTIQTIGVSTPKLTTLSWAPDGIILSAGLLENTILLWDIDNDNIDFLDRQTDGILSLAWSPDGQFLAAGLQDGTVNLFEHNQDEQLRRLIYSPDRRDYIADLTWSPDGQFLVTASCDSESSMPANCRLIFWDPSNGQYGQTIKGSASDFTSVAWSPSGRYVASADLNGDVALYDPASGKRLRNYRTPIGWTVVSWAPNGQILAAGSEDGSVLLWGIH